MKISIRQLATITACSATGVGVIMVLLGMEPRLVLVGCIAALIATTTWLMIEVGGIVSPIDWYNYGGNTDTTARPDRRVLLLRARVRQPARRRGPMASIPDGVEPPDEIADSLLAVIDDHLAAEHGIDGAADPDRAAEVLGPELARFISDPVSRRSMTQRRALARTVSLIEDL